MISPHDFAQKQMELTAEFGKFVLEHPETDDRLPDGACLYFEVSGEPEFNRYSRELADRRRTEGFPTVMVRVRGLVPPQGSRLIDPVIESSPAVA